MSIPEPTSIIDLLAPPKGYDFYAGIWLTHDLDWSTLCDLVAPALADVTATGDRRLQEVRGSIAPGAPGLLILHAGGDHFAGGPALPWARELAVPGRRQHAKAALLLFRSPSGKKLRTRAFIASANLTRSGLTSNLEVVSWDERGAASTPFLGVDLFREIVAFTKTIPSNRIAKPVIKALRSSLRGAEPTGMVTSSLVTETPIVPNRRRGERPATSLVIVSPSFAGNTDTKAGEALAPWCGPGTSVDIYAPFQGTRVLAASGEKGLVLSKGLLSVLKRTGAKVTVHAVAAFDDDASTSRRLHAKVLGITRANGTTAVLSGSANCTGPGLEGRNREMMVRQDLRPRQLAAMLEGLDAVPFTGAIEPPPRKLPKPTVGPVTAVDAVFEIDATASADGSRWSGFLTVTMDPSDNPAKVTYNGQTIPIGEPVPVSFDPALGTIEIRSAGATRFSQVHVEAPAGIADFWNRLTPERRIDRPDHELVRLLRDIDKPPKARRPPHPGSKTTTPSPADDGFSIPLGQRLVLLARLRRSLRDRSHVGIAKLLDDYLDARTESERKAGVRAEEVTASRATALAIHAAYDPKAPDVRSPLLRSLRDAVEAFDVLCDEDAGEGS